MKVWTGSVSLKRNVSTSFTFPSSDPRERKEEERGVKKSKRRARSAGREETGVNKSARGGSAPSSVPSSCFNHKPERILVQTVATVPPRSRHHYTVHAVRQDYLRVL